ncbi:OFA family MFS transporter [candidate division WOR-3 bacterium]|nr:OFA family MFS transporter [candidate division WOR-3 bacterium]
MTESIAAPAAPKTFNRWLVVVGALLIQVSLGAVYIWSVFRTPLLESFKTWTKTQVTLPSQVVLAVFALAVIFGGRVQDRLGPRIVATAGGLILGVGLILARFTWNLGAPEMVTQTMPDGSLVQTAVATNATAALVWLIATFSVLGGLGIGASYVCPIATCVKWFPDRRGLITGLAVAGFGAGAVFFGPLAEGFIYGKTYNLLGLSLFKLPKVGLFNTFMALGIIFLAVIVLGAQLLRNPEPGYRPAGWNPPQPAAGSAPKVDFTPGEMLRTGRFWLLWITYLAGCTAGLGVIMNAKFIWQSFEIGRLASQQPLAKAVFDGISTAGALAVGLQSIFNAAGRIAWGKVSDVVSRRATLFVMFLLCGAAMLVLNYLRPYPLYIAGICVVGLCFGGYLALFPAVTADFYGTKHYGVNYGWMFSAYGVGGIVGPYLIGALVRTINRDVGYYVTGSPTPGAGPDRLFDVAGYQTAFLVAGIMCLAAAALTLLVRRPVPKRSAIH